MDMTFEEYRDVRSSFLKACKDQGIVKEKMIRQFLHHEYPGLQFEIIRNESNPLALEISYHEDSHYTAQQCIEVEKAIVAYWKELQ